MERNVADAPSLTTDVRLKTMPSTIPDCDEVFSRFFDRWYDDADRQRKGFAHTRPDMMVAYRSGITGSDICPFSEEAEKDVLGRIERMLHSVRVDWPAYLEVSGDIDRSWIAAFDRYYDTERIAEVISHSDPEDFSNDMIVIACQFGAALGQVMRQSEPRLQWVAEWPYWESGLYDPETGNIIPPFHWAIKKFSEYGVDDGYAEKIDCMIHVLNSPESNGEQDVPPNA